ncbi:DUF3307 domain-containing protein [Actinoplanes sp. TRM 88003]|uniref:DUF3307 domain-containing protein n=1 Tax=Paractinoplanes aksuensis TaxID=2939490 RepID=A0ABT1DPP2_9ACTN|nr:DUF3307 domain-containing protein [Actinoplanes aksuensis]MCO8272827.1 DUF3307 domain-containing protein [Actinoplanes aksuensis]
MTALFAAVFIALFTAHQVADHWVQTQHQADRKADPGWGGRVACATHVAAYTATAVFALLALEWALGVQLNPGKVAAGLTVSAITHYAADRRTLIKRLAQRCGIGRFYALGAPRPGRDDNPTLGGAYALDQSFHYAWLFAAALIIA